MPTPTPPQPGEEPADERELYRYHFRRLTGWYIEALDAVPAEAYAWIPPVPGANALRAILSHAVSSAEWWVLSCVGQRPLERDRDAEFYAETDWPTVRARLQRWLADAEALLAAMDSADFAAVSRHPAGDRMKRRCLTHTIEHLGLHLGHVELTIDWWKATHSAG
ncbi:MAG: hypothetical protein PVSMB4_12200 [Ktedonobacterales bacterium]